jgi:hypothetical protein
MWHRFWVLLTSLLLAVPVWALDDNPWVTVDTPGHLTYRTTKRGDRIVDFSYAGYMGGGIPLPKVPITETVSPSDGHDTAVIQAAIDRASRLPIKGGFRGAVKLAAGTFRCSGTLKISSSGVVLRGSGFDSKGTTIQMTGDAHVAITIAGTETIEARGPTVHMVQDYVPSGSRSITLDDASSIREGDTIRIRRITTPQWLRFMGMDNLVRDGQPEVWVGNSITTYRKVAARDGNELILDVPLTDSYDRAYLPPEGAEVTKVEVHGDIEQVGVEWLHIEAPPRDVGFDEPLFQTMKMSGVRDAWVREMVVDDVTEGIDVGADVARVTLQGIIHKHTRNITTPAKPADFALRGTQLLVVYCGSKGNDESYVITGPRNQGPNVVLDSVFMGNGFIEPHQRWSTGFLVDSTKVPQGSIQLKNRGEMGSGHGWTVGWGVVWNCVAGSFIIQNPPGAANWSIGNTGPELGEPMKRAGVRRRDLGPDLAMGYVESAGKPVHPVSLYRQQLQERLGPGALKALEP